MNVFLIAAISLDGFVAQHKTQSSLTWTSKVDRQRFVTLTKKAGVVIMGSTTFATIGKPLKDRRNIIYTSQPEKFKGIDIETTQELPKTLLQRLEKEGVQEVAVCGGPAVWTQFIKANLIHQFYITIEPIVFGSGIPLLGEEVTVKLDLLSSQNIDNTLLLDYNVMQ